MMNRYNDSACRFGSRDSRGLGGDRSLYRRPASRGGILSPTLGGSGGCGCASGRGQRRDLGPVPSRGTHHDHPGDQPGSVSSGSCGCRCASPSRGCDHDSPHSGCGCGHGDPHSGCGHQQPAGCGCNRNLMDRIRAVDFALYEVVLYLDVYPHSCDALETYHKLKSQREALRREYESAYGPLTAFSNESGASWDWIDKPFPWEYEAE